MGRLKVLASGSASAQAQARGKLFETLMAEVLRHYGYRIDRTPSANYAGMEIDIEGRQLIANTPLYAECKCYETEVDSPKFQAFFGKYFTRWLRDARCHGLFIALPGVNSHAKAFYRENAEKNSQITLRMLEEEQVLEAIFAAGLAARPDVLARQLPSTEGSPGDSALLYTDRGPFWTQYVIAPGAGIPTSVALFDAHGRPISDPATIDYLTQLSPDLGDFQKLIISDSLPRQHSSATPDPEEVVEVKGSSARFEYQFPASPQYFVGRSLALADLDAFVTEIIEGRTSARGVLFEANSGWGKSSTVLASAARLSTAGHFAIAIDSRSASSSQFILRVAEYALRKLADHESTSININHSSPLTGFDGATHALIQVGDVLRRRHKVMALFLDQFENVFFLPEALQRITDLLLKLCDAEVSVILGFSWKTDLIGLTSEFPYRLRDTIRDVSKRIALQTFTQVETKALLDELQIEIRAPLRKDLIFFLSEFSQGYPWLLTKLCAHVKAQREAGVPQADIAYSLLNVEELFQEDLSGLTGEEEDALRRIAKAAPVSVVQLNEEFRYEIVQRLVHRRLVVRIGSKYDIYWDIFRDYLNSGQVPVRENYILRVSFNSVLRAVRLMVESNGSIAVSELRERAGLTKKCFYNLMRDLRLSGLVKVHAGQITLQSDLLGDLLHFEDALRSFLRDRLPRNRLIRGLLQSLEVAISVSMEDLSRSLADACPYISASADTWDLYARTFVDWMDAADLVVLDRRTGTVRLYDPHTEVRERRIFTPRGRSGVVVPSIQYTPLEGVMLRIARGPGSGRIDWTGFRGSTINKALKMLSDLGFIAITSPARSIRVLPPGLEFAARPERRRELFADRAMSLESFAVFICILHEHSGTRLSLSALADGLRDGLRVNWKEGTAVTNAKILLDWARHSGMAPPVYARAGSAPSPWQQRLQL